MGSRIGHGPAWRFSPNIKVPEARLWEVERKFRNQSLFPLLTIVISGNNLYSTFDAYICGILVFVVVPTLFLQLQLTSPIRSIDSERVAGTLRSRERA